jgi:hypothetical protein
MERNGSVALFYGGPAEKQAATHESGRKRWSNVMAGQTGNLSLTERATSALFGLALSILAVRRGSPLVRAMTGAAGASLLARAYAGHCGVKAAVTGHTSLSEGLGDQWRCMSRGRAASAQPLPGSPVHSKASEAVDESVSESFPASDPPASRLPDEPPVNAEAKWEAARAAERRRDH